MRRRQLPHRTLGVPAEKPFSPAEPAASGLGEHEQVAVDPGADSRGAGDLVRAGGARGPGVSWLPVMAACRATMCWA